MLQIDECGDCKHCLWENSARMNGQYCDHEKGNKMELDDLLIIHLDCPLEDAPEQEGE